MKDDKICFSRTLTYLVLLVAVVFGAFWVINYANTQKLGQTPKAGASTCQPISGAAWCERVLAKDNDMKANGITYENTGKYCAPTGEKDYLAKEIYGWTADYNKCPVVRRCAYGNKLYFRSSRSFIPNFTSLNVNLTKTVNVNGKFILCMPETGRECVLGSTTSPASTKTNSACNAVRADVKTSCMIAGKPLDPTMNGAKTRADGYGMSGECILYKGAYQSLACGEATGYKNVTRASCSKAYIEDDLATGCSYNGQLIPNITKNGYGIGPSVNNYGACITRDGKNTGALCEWNDATTSYITTYNQGGPQGMCPVTTTCSFKLNGRSYKENECVNAGNGYYKIVECYKRTGQIDSRLKDAPEDYDCPNL